MIKNFIFDFGNVLTQYDPIAWATNIMGGDREKGVYLHDKTIDNKKFWDDYDAGLCSEEEIIERLSCDIEPEYRNAVKEFTTTVERCFKQYDEMVPVLNELKKLPYIPSIKFPKGDVYPRIIQMSYFKATGRHGCII